jgi:hypothetical protein
MLLPRFCSLAHLCPLLNTGHHEVEGVAAIHLSLLGPRSRQIIQQSVPVAAGSSVHDEQLASTLGKLTDVIGNLGTLLTDNMSRNARSTRDPKQRLISGHKFDTSKIHLFSLKYRMTVGMCYTQGDRADPTLYAGSPPLATIVLSLRSKPEIQARVAKSW